MLTLSEICEKIISQYDPDDVLEMLEITTEELLDAFEYRVRDLYDKLNEEFEDDN